jgi:hypothetical protein
MRIEEFGKAGRYLGSLGWRFKPSTLTPGTASCSEEGKIIYMRPRAFHNPDTRILRYVIPHEIAHALHCTFNPWFECDEFAAKRGISKWSAVEVIADAMCILNDPSRTMRAWVRASVVWHNSLRRRFKYRWADVVSDDARQFAIRLCDQLDQVAPT